MNPGLRFLFFLLWMFPLMALSQRNLMVPPAPEATSVFKFMEVPVSTYAGLVNTSIPLYEIQANGVSIPIGLSYHARGVRVEEVASRVGIGWSLSYGGMISRQVRGVADDAFGSSGSPSFYSNIFVNEAVALSIWEYYTNGQPLDFDPDMYSFDFPGHSGKFMFDPRDRAVLLQQYSDIKIVPVLKNERMEGLIVTDQTGNKYYFGLSKDQLRSAFDYDKVENFSYSTTMADLGSSESNDINTWHLLEIETANNDLVQFYYENETPVYYRRQYDKNNEGLPGAISYFGKIVGSQKQISEIIFRNGKVKFTKATATRDDLPGAYALQKVEVFDKNDSLVKGYAFQYQYPATVQDDNQLYYLKAVDPSASKRLFLQSLREYGKSSESLPPYVFTYSDQPLPNRFSNSQDNWGFYNGKPNGSFLTFFNYSAQGVSREVDTVKSEAGLLKRIDYPTGGGVTFTYEHNRGIAPYFLKEVIYANNNPSERIPVIDGFLKHSSYYQYSPAYNDTIYAKEIIIGPNKVGNVSFTFDLPWCGTMEDESRVCNYRARLVGNGVTYYLYPYPPNGTGNLNIPPGTYHLDVLPPAGHDPSDYRNTFIADIRWEIENTISEDTLMFAAGKRIKRIEYRDQHGIVKVKEFSYVDPATGKSSGIILGLPGFFAPKDIILPPGGVPPGPITVKYGSLPGSPLTNHQGNGIGYSFVTEYFGEAGKNTGKIDYTFTTTEDGGKYYEFPYHLAIDNEWLRGKPLTSKVYEKVDTGYLLQRETINKYTYADRPGVQGVFFSPLHHADSNHTYQRNRRYFYLPLLIFQKDTMVQHNYKVYYQTGGAMDLYSTTEKNYTYSPQLLQEQETTYFFDYDKHYQSVRTETLNSKEDSVITRTWYPPDLTSRTPAEQKMIDLNRVGIPVKVETTIKQKGTGSQLSKKTLTTIFKDWENNIITPELIKSAVNASPLETETQYISYDANGNPTELMDRDGIHIVYLWGYASQYPVARVVGSDYNTVKGFVNLAMLTNAHQYTDQQIRTELNKIRTGLAGTVAQVFIYTYKPLVGMSSQTDPKGQLLFYEYDKLNRLELIRDHHNNIIKKINYSYAEPTTSSLVYYSAAKSRVFHRTNCGARATGGAVLYEVPDSLYTSTISQPDADQKAENDLSTNGPEYANQHGSCTFFSVEKSGNFTRTNCGPGTGLPYTYTVPEGTFSSTISQADADQKAQDAVNTNGPGEANINGTCSLKVFLKLELGLIEPIAEGNCLEQYQDVVISFYTDAALSIPVNVSNLSFQIKRGRTPYTNGNPGTTTYTTTTYTASGTSFTLSQQLTYEGCATNCPEGFGCLPRPNDPHTQYIFSLVTSTFTINPYNP